MCVCVAANSTLVIMKLKNKSEKLSLHNTTTLAATLMNLSMCFILCQDTTGPHAIFLSLSLNFLFFRQHSHKLVGKEVRVVSTKSLVWQLAISKLYVCQCIYTEWDQTIQWVKTMRPRAMSEDISWHFKCRAGLDCVQVVSKVASSVLGRAMEMQRCCYTKAAATPQHIN